MLQSLIKKSSQVIADFKKILLENGYTIINQIRLEPPIFGTFFLTFGINRRYCKILSMFIYPMQFFVSKIFLSSESIMIIVKKNGD